MTLRPLTLYSEQEGAIHEYLVAHVERFLQGMRQALLTGTQPGPLVLLWPQQPLTGDDGSHITRTIILRVGDGEATITAPPVVDAIRHTNACAVLCMAPHAHEMRAELHTLNRVYTWRMSMEKRGLDTMYGEVTRTGGG